MLFRSVKGLGESRPLWKILRVLGNLLELEGFEYDSSEQILHDALDAQRLPEKLNNRSSWQGEAAPAAEGLIRTGGVGIYHTDAIVRRAEALQQTSHAQVPPARIHPDTLTALGLADGATAEAVQNGSRVRVTVVADNTLPPNVVHLPQHSANAVLGGLMNAIKLEKI